MSPFPTLMNGLKTVIPSALWEGMKRVRTAHQRQRLHRKHYLPWLRQMMMPPSYKRGARFVQGWTEPAPSAHRQVAVPRTNPLWEYARNYTEGPGFWKWDHFYEVYHRHLGKFVGGPVTVCEIGIFSGGSLDMWSAYFGEKCRIYGIDLEPACKNYETANVTIDIGDQEDEQFWREFRRRSPQIDVLIDDGGHTPQQQIVTLEQMLPHLAPGGVFICEDIYGVNNRFAAYAAALVDKLNAKEQKTDSIGVQPTAFQAQCHSIHFYPYIVVIEKHDSPPTELICPKRGTEWSPYYRQPK